MTARHRSSGGRWAGLLLCLLCACRKQAPAEDGFAVLLAQAESAAAAEALRAEVAGLDADLADAQVRRVAHPEGVPLHLVLSRPFASREEAEALRHRLEQTHHTRLEVIEMPAPAPAVAAEVAPANRPELLALLPLPAEELALEALRWIGEGAGAPAPGTPAVLDRFESRLQTLACRQQARAAWRAPDGGRLLAWVCLGSVEELLPAIHRALLTVPEPVRPPPARRAGKKKDARAPRSRPPTVTDIIQQALPLPAASDQILPWGQAGAHDFQVKLGAHRGAPAAEWAARLAPLPEGKGAFLALATSPQLLDRALARRGLGLPRGLLAAPTLRSLDPIWIGLEAQGETLVELGFERLADFARGQGGAVEPALGRLPVLLASFCREGACWTLRAAQLPEPALALQLYDRLLVGPRADFVRRVLSDKKFKVNYDVGVVMREIGHHSGWQLRGAGGGPWSELYFVRERVLYLLQARPPEKGATGLDLVEKALRVVEASPPAAVP